ncbi:hypothetical protein MTR67_022687 [Solanum verrucosum]|uniref:Integrase catalytic domain-containing protein n=1 Tax=Solanum verrucosum TaxID=315347 RepID=A0AAF0TQR0_SOLVR|nr:hypothetical protein MTR67_022687 [Solanum verrucosum]
MAPFEALYSRSCRSLVGWFEHTEPRSRGTNLIQKALDKLRVVQDRLRTAQSRHQSYANRRRRPLRFSIGDRVFLCVSPMNGVMRFGRRGKLSSRYIRPFEILRTIGEVSYELALSPVFSAIHPVFHVSMLRWYVPDESHVFQYDAVELDDRLTFVEEPSSFSTERLARIYIREVVQLHGMPVSIISDRGSHFTSSFWRTFQDELGTRVDLSTSFHPQTDGQLECTIQMVPFEALHGKRCRSPVSWFDFTEPRPWVLDLIQEALDQGLMRFGRRSKLSPRYIGPFEILQTIAEVAYELALPPYDAVELHDRLTFVEEPVVILDTERSKRIQKRKHTSIPEIN